MTEDGSKQTQDVISTPQPQVEVKVEQKPPESTPEPQVQEKKESKDVDVNWRKAREVMRSQAQELENLKAKINSLENPKKNDFEGIDKDDFVTFEQAELLATKKAEKKAIEIASHIVDEKMRILEGNELERRARDKYSDYDYVIEKFAIPMIEENPQLAQAIRANPNWAEVAYKLAKTSTEYEKEMIKRQENTQAVEKVIKNTERPVSANAAVGSLQSTVESFASMSPEDVWKRSREYARRF